MKNGMHIDMYGSKVWYQNDEISREDGPAIERANGDKEWHVNGKFIRRENSRKENSTEQTGKKFDQDKPRMDLLDSGWLEDVAQVLTFGAAKYGDDNWRGGIAYRRLIAAAYRHLGAINRGEDADLESGLPHSSHLSCCVMMLSAMMRDRPDLDDRYKVASHAER